MRIPTSLINISVGDLALEAKGLRVTTATITLIMTQLILCRESLARFLFSQTSYCLCGKEETRTLCGLDLQSIRQPCASSQIQNDFFSIYKRVFDCWNHSLVVPLRLELRPWDFSSCFKGKCPALGDSTILFCCLSWGRTNIHPFKGDFTAIIRWDNNYTFFT